MTSYPTSQPVMQTQTVMTAAMPVQGMPVVMPAVPVNTMKVGVTRGLAITQLVIGFLSLCFGIGAVAGFHKSYWLTNSGAGIYGGTWILVTGIIGVCSASYPTSGGLNGTHMAFSIISTIVAFINGIMFAVGVGVYANCNSYRYYYYNYYRSNWECRGDQSAGAAVYGCLLLLMVAEFFVALIAAIYCCQASSACCGSYSTPGIIIQPQTQYITTSSTGQTMLTAAYPASTGISTTGQYQYAMHPATMQQQVPMMYPPVSGANTNVAYSSQYPPQQDYKATPPPAYE